MSDPATPHIAEQPFPERFINSYVTGLREGHRFALDSQAHVDKMLTWAIGLMGAGILGSDEFFKAYHPTARLVAVIPWIFGILCAVAGRLVARELMDRDNLFFFQKVTRLENAPLLHRDDNDALLREVQAAINDEGQEDKRDALKRLRESLSKLYYAAHILLGIGVLIILAILSLQFMVPQSSRLPRV
jgi:hypothetical protein